MWDERYSNDQYAYGQQPNAFLSESAGYLLAGATLCIAEGEGRNAVFLASVGHDVTAMDQSEAGLAKAKQLAADKGVPITTVAGDLNDFNMGEERWDNVVSIFGHVPAPLRRKVHSRVTRALKPGGTFLLVAYRPEQLETSGEGGPPATQMDMFVTEADLRKELPELEFVMIDSVVRSVDEGQYHHGEAAVVQMIARKPKDAH